PEMRNTVEDRRQSSDIKALDAPGLQKLTGCLSTQHRPCLGYHRLQSAHQFVFRDRPPFGKLGRTMAPIGSTTQAGHDPLPQIAAQVQDQVADAIETRLGAPPQLLVTQLTKAVPDAIQGAIQLVRRRGPNGNSQFVGSHADFSTSAKARTGKVPMPL